MGCVTGDEVLFYLRCSERFSSEVTFRQRCKRKGEVRVECREAGYLEGSLNV